MGVMGMCLQTNAASAAVLSGKIEIMCETRPLRDLRKVGITEVKTAL